jgi:hypothetical protein
MPEPFDQITTGIGELDPSTWKRWTDAISAMERLIAGEIPPALGAALKARGVQRPMIFARIDDQLSARDNVGPELVTGATSPTTGLEVRWKYPWTEVKLNGTTFANDDDDVDSSGDPNLYGTSADAGLGYALNLCEARNGQAVYSDLTGDGNTDVVVAPGVYAHTGDENYSYPSSFEPREIHGQPVVPMWWMLDRDTDAVRPVFFAVNHHDGTCGTTGGVAAHDIDVVLADASSAAFTITLPNVAGAVEQRFYVKKVDSSVNAVTVSGNGADTIDGQGTQVISIQYDSLTLFSNGTEWFIL